MQSLLDFEANPAELCPYPREKLPVLTMTGHESLDNLVGKTLIGAMSQESAFRYFERVPNKAVITGGDNNEVILSALNTPTSCIVLTGGLLPAQEAINRARLPGIPMISVKEDTLAASEKVEKLIARIVRPTRRRSRLSRKRSRATWTCPGS
jgi:BioD-like phosphotransacetylase family protein